MRGEVKRNEGLMNNANEQSVARIESVSSSILDESPTEVKRRTPRPRKKEETTKERQRVERCFILFFLLSCRLLSCRCLSSSLSGLIKGDMRNMSANLTCSMDDEGDNLAFSLNSALFLAEMNEALARHIVLEARPSVSSSSSSVEIGRAHV